MCVCVGGVTEPPGLPLGYGSEVAHKIIIVAFPIIEPLTVLMVAQSFILMHNSAVSGSMKD